MSTMYGLVPKGMVKCNAVALMVALDLLFRDDSHDHDDDVKETRRKLVEGKLLQLLCLASRVIHVGGMVDDSVIGVTKNLFKNFVANSPEHLRKHNEDMLAKGNEIFFA